LQKKGSLRKDNSTLADGIWGQGKKEGEVVEVEKTDGEETNLSARGITKDLT